MTSWVFYENPYCRYLNLFPYCSTGKLCTLHMPIRCCLVVSVITYCHPERSSECHASLSWISSTFLHLNSCMGHEGDRTPDFQNFKTLAKMAEMCLNYYYQIRIFFYVTILIHKCPYNFKLAFKYKNLNISLA